MASIPCMLGAVMQITFVIGRHDWTSLEHLRYACLTMITYSFVMRYIYGVQYISCLLFDICDVFSTYTVLCQMHSWNFCGIICSPMLLPEQSLPKLVGTPMKLSPEALHVSVKCPLPLLPLQCCYKRHIDASMAKRCPKNLPLPKRQHWNGERGTKQCIRKRLMCVRANNFGNWDCSLCGVRNCNIEYCYMEFWNRIQL